MKEFDFVVVGSGIAGLSFALKPPRKAPSPSSPSATSPTRTPAFAQGGVACVTSARISFDLHIADTLTAGVGLCHEDAVRAVVTEGPARIHELMDLGLHFDERETANGSHELDLARRAVTRSAACSMCRTPPAARSSKRSPAARASIRKSRFSRTTWP